MREARRRRILLAGLCASQVVSWGVLYYAFPAVSATVAADTGWSLGAVTTAFSVGLVLSAIAGVPVGRLLDRVGARSVMTAGTLGGALGLVAVALAPTLPWLVAAWCVTGIAQSATLYQAAFAVIIRTSGEHRTRGLTILTLAAGLASTVFAPVAAALTDAAGWRAALVVLAGILVATVTPIHLLVVPARWPDEAAPAPGSDAGGRVRDIVRSAPFVRAQAGMTLLTLALYGATLTLVPLLLAQGYDTATAVVAFGLVGVGQVAGRILFASGSWSPGRAGLAVGAATVVALVGLALLPRPFPALVVVVLLAGAARGALTLVQASIVVDRWGTARLGQLSGAFAVPVTGAAAVAPALGAWLLTSVGGTAGTLLLAGLAALGLAVTALVPGRADAAGAAPDGPATTAPAAPTRLRPDVR
ncbi:MFS transporter [Clavibacter zhangzhiyongii]|uniref:MFS transporter n=1 Tax=Clavibacter zhangzhiyongii TaxID=2768071 RepID=A0A7L7Z2Z6_9MICO|nr:MFS transporter [Clavibacter zhangzhiyongii]QOD44082.1 MFS transporter [Clavibacter zhangzhiyongii]